MTSFRHYTVGVPLLTVLGGWGELLFLEPLSVPPVRMSILVPIPCCPNYHGLIISAISLCFQDLLVCSWLFAFPYTILHQLVNFYQKETTGILVGIALSLGINRGESIFTVL